MPSDNFDSVQFITVDDDREGQRVDNFLRTLLKGVPKSLIYRILRKGEVRANKKRIKPEYKLIAGDVLRIPPIRVASEDKPINPKLAAVQKLEQQILFEDDALLVLNKPSGFAVHGGSGLNYGVIEALRVLRPEQRYFELVHRLDRDTSGCLLIAKKRSALRALHEQLREKQMDKRYWALVSGHWPKAVRKVTAPLHKNQLQSGERMVRVNEQGKPSETRYRILESYQQATLVEAFPFTGRTHQIRVHCQHVGHGIAGDDKYGDESFDKRLKPMGLKRLCLHAYSLRFMHPGTEEVMQIQAPLSADYQQLINALREG